MSIWGFTVTGVDGTVYEELKDYVVTADGRIHAVEGGRLWGVNANFSVGYRYDPAEEALRARWTILLRDESDAARLVVHARGVGAEFVEQAILSGMAASDILNIPDGHWLNAAAKLASSTPFTFRQAIGVCRPRRTLQYWPGQHPLPVPQPWNPPTARRRRKR